MVDELTKKEVQVLTSMCTSLLLEEVCFAKFYRQNAIESLISKHLVRRAGFRIVLTPQAITYISKIIINRALTELTPEGKAQMMEDIMDGKY